MKKILSLISAVFITALSFSQSFTTGSTLATTKGYGSDSCWRYFIYKPSGAGMAGLYLSNGTDTFKLQIGNDVTQYITTNYHWFDGNVVIDDSLKVTKGASVGKFLGCLDAIGTVGWQTVGGGVSTNGNGTTVNGSAVDLGGNLNVAATEIKMDATNQYVSYSDTSAAEYVVAFGDAFENGAPAVVIVIPKIFGAVDTVYLQANDFIQLVTPGTFGNSYLYLDSNSCAIVSQTALNHSNINTDTSAFFIRRGAENTATPKLYCDGNKISTNAIRMGAFTGHGFDSAVSHTFLDLSLDSGVYIRGKDESSRIFATKDSTERIIFAANADGSLIIRDGNEGAGKVLTSDASGVASWDTLPIYSGLYKPDTVALEEENISFLTLDSALYSISGNVVTVSGSGSIGTTVTRTDARVTFNLIPPIPPVGTELYGLINGVESSTYTVLVGYCFAGAGTGINFLASVPLPDEQYQFSFSISYRYK